MIPATHRLPYRPQSNADYPSSLGKVEFTLDLPQQIHDKIIELRTTPEFDNFDYEIVSRLHHIDLAGEWTELSTEFKEVMKDLQVEYTVQLLLTP